MADPAIISAAAMLVAVDTSPGEDRCRVDSTSPNQASQPTPTFTIAQWGCGSTGVGTCGRGKFGGPVAARARSGFGMTSPRTMKRLPNWDSSRGKKREQA